VIPVHTYPIVARDPTTGSLGWQRRHGRAHCWYRCRGHPAVNGLQGYVATTEGAADTLDYDETPHEDLCGHGTACAGIIRSLAPCCEFYSVRVLDENLTRRARSSPPDCAGRSRLGCTIAT
jgi:hypothetical protein